MEAVTRLRQALQEPEGPPVEARETHVSCVLLTRDRAYKLKKPVRMAFVDQSTPELRRALCEEEVRVNRELAPDVVLGVRALVPAGDGWAVADADRPDAVEWMVEMRRFDEEQTMRARLRRGALTEADVDAAAQRIAAFHAIAERAVGRAHAAAVLGQYERNFEELGPLVEGVVSRAAHAVAARFAGAFVAARRDALDARAGAGLVVDGHGDLRAEHVLLEDGAVTLVDRLEFDRELRTVDVADDLAFLVMDLESRDGAWVAERLVAAYRAAGGQPGDDALIAFFATYRAQVRAKVAFLRGDVARGRALLALAERFAWRARGPVLLLVTGPPASGKSTLARALSDASGLPVLSTDAARKQALGLPLDARAPAGSYTPEQRADVYRRIGAEAAQAVTRHGAIVDATFGDEELQAAFFDGLPDAAVRAARVIECQAPARVLAERIAARSAGDAHGSDVPPAVARRLAEAFTGVRLRDAARLVVETDVPAGELVPRVAAWLDGPMSTDG